MGRAIESQCPTYLIHSMSVSPGDFFLTPRVQRYTTRNSLFGCRPRVMPPRRPVVPPLRSQIKAALIIGHVKTSNKPEITAGGPGPKDTTFVLLTGPALSLSERQSIDARCGGGGGPSPLSCSRYHYAYPGNSSARRSVGRVLRGMRYCTRAHLLSRGRACRTRRRRCPRSRCVSSWSASCGSST